jgi:MFS superfamily sulfate permease-like transporter
MSIIRGAFDQIKHDLEDFLEEVVEECNPCNLMPTNPAQSFKLSNLIHIPYLPAIHQPGWMMRYGLGPFDKEWTEMMIADCQAGLTVTMTLIPQGLSQATLANLPPIYGLYAALVPSATYAFFGSSMQLTVGPTALISLLTGSIITKYGVDFENDLPLAVDTAAQAAFCCGLIIVVLGLLNLGNIINFMSHPVMSGFTTGAAMTIGLSQLRSAVGMSLAPPQVGRDVEYTYEVCHWWLQNWNGYDDKGYSLRNHYASKVRRDFLYIFMMTNSDVCCAQICFGLYIPLMFVTLIKWYWKPTPDVKKSGQFKLWTLFTTLLPLAAIIIGGHVAYSIKESDHFQDPGYEHDYYAKSLKLVGEIPAGVDILRIPHFRWPMGQFFLDVLPLTLIAFMESYSIARSIAASNNQLNMLNASQEMFANGVANLMGCMASAYPVSGSFSRSALVRKTYLFLLCT